MKISINLLVPAIGKDFDVLIPDFVKIAELTPLLSQAVSELSNHEYVSSHQELLCHRELNLLLSQDKTFDDYQIQNGDHIYLL